MDLKKVLDEVSGFIKLHGDRVYEHWDEVTVAEEKDAVDISTNFDVEIEKLFAEFVSVHFPEHGFKGEELSELNREGEYVWHIDPIDGTKYFIKGVPLWGLTLALVKGDEPVLGVIYNPVAKQLYTAYQGGGAFMNEKKLEINPETDPAKVQLVWDLTTWKYEWEKYKDKLTGASAQLMSTFYRVRALGNGAYSLAWLAQGLFGAYADPYRHKDKFVDIAAGVLIAKEAGAAVYRNPLGNDLEQLIIAKSELIDVIRPIIELKA